VTAVPLQNRVDPYGRLHAVAERGTLMGNRGVIHDESRRVVATWRLRRWIACTLTFKGRRRQVFAPRRYSELFFLDEATALAAGHRPCAECQRARYDLFRTHWIGRGRALPGADEMDAVLHGQRVAEQRAKRTYTERLSRLPSGALVADPDGKAYLVQEAALLHWTPAGYGARLQPPAGTRLRVLTPRSSVRALTRGYPVEVHASARRGGRS